MRYRLLVDLEVLAFLQALPSTKRKRLLDHFHKIRSSPEAFSDYHEQDAIGRRVEISVFAGYAIHFWLDFADRHVKVLAVNLADA